MRGNSGIIFNSKMQDSGFYFCFLDYIFLHSCCSGKKKQVHTGHTNRVLCIQRKYQFDVTIFLNLGIYSIVYFVRKSQLPLFCHVIHSSLEVFDNICGKNVQWAVQHSSASLAPSLTTIHTKDNDVDINILFILHDSKHFSSK